MFFAGGGAEGRDRVAQALLGQGDHVHITLNHDDFVEVAVVLARFEQAVEFLALVKHRGLRRVQVLGLVVPEYTAAEGDDAATAVADREHHAVAEAVIALAGLGVFHQQAGIDHGLLLEGVAAQVFIQIVPARRSEAETEVPSDFAGEAAAFEVVDSGLALRMALECLAVKIGGSGKQRVQRRIGGLPGFVRAATFFAGHFHSCGFSQVLDSLGEVQVVVVHQETQGIPSRPATEAVIELLVGADAEGWGFFFMERAAGGVVFAGFFQLYA